MMFYVIIENQAYQLQKNSEYIIGPSSLSDITLNLTKNYQFRTEQNSLFFNNQNYSYGVHHILCEDKSLSLLILKYQKYVLIDSDTIYISSQSHSDIIIPETKLKIIFKEDNLFINSIYYHNGKEKNGITQIKDYDHVVLTQGYVFVKIQNILMIASLTKISSQYPLLDKISQVENRSDDFHRSPRIILRQPDDKISILAPPSEEEASKQSLIKMIIMPLSMIAITVIMYILSAGGSMIIMMVAMSSVTILMSIHSYFSDKKRAKQRADKQINDYINYLDKKSEELHALALAQKKALDYHFPSTKNIISMVKEVDRRIYEKTIHHFDFLDYNLGIASLKPSFMIDYKQTDMTKYHQLAHDKIEQILKFYSYIDNLPLCNNLSKGPIGYIGSRKIVLEQIQQMMMQIATFHSYHDVTFIPIFREEELSLWEWSRWLPHTMIKALNLRSFIYNQKTRDQILTSIYQIIKDRKMNSQQNNNKELVYTPQFIFLITDLSLLLDHNIMEYINEDLSHLGINYIFIEDVMESLPEHVKTVVDYKNEKRAILILKNGEYLAKEFTPLESIDLIDKELYATSLKAINHVQTLRNSIPKSVTFLEIYQVEKVEELNILQRWQQNDTYKTMAVPLGLRGRNELLYLNLHEKAHGPHGLIAGTTGSGKSELVQSYILSLAVNYHPYEVSFLLIDYKGGGMANLFAYLPHLLGTITNLDANQSQRALLSIKAELKRRQRMFAEAEVNHINQYLKLFKQGEVKEPLAHLFLISDEFAELKAEQPDFMKELVSTARIGRSLGIHLILATQKPSGVVDDQIWSNSKFKIALKVQDAADSREIIKTSDAADITLPGRAYLQVGNNEIYELFQSAWSGADYYPNGKETRQKTKTIYQIKDNGQYEAINQDLSGLDKFTQIKSLATELDAIILHTKELFASLNLPKLKSPWLPPLKHKILASELQSIDYKDYWFNPSDNLSILIGYQDIPENQQQSALYFDVDDVGHILVVGSPGYGKSTFLSNFAMDIMRKQQPSQSNLYLYDFGTNGLISISDFPHVGDYFSLDATEKIQKSLRYLYDEVKLRKKELSKAKASNLQQYNQIANHQFPRIFILIDGFDAVAESPFADAFYEVLNLIARDGTSIGMYLIVTMSRLNSMRLALQSNFKTKISLFLFDYSDLSSIVGRTSLNLEEIKGRAIAKFEQVVQFQVSLAFSSDNYVEYIKEIKVESQNMRNDYKGNLPMSIPMLPEIVTPQDLINDLNNPLHLALGLEREIVTPTFFNLEQAFIMASDNPNYLLNYLKLIEYNLSFKQEKRNILILDPNQKIPNNIFLDSKRITSSLELSDVLPTIITNLKERINNPNQKYQLWLILIPDISAVVLNSVISEHDLRTLIIEGARHGITLAFVGNYQDLIGNSYDSSVKLINQLVEQVFIGMRISDQNHTRYPYIVNETMVKLNQGYILQPDHYQFIQLLELERNKL